MVGSLITVTLFVLMVLIINSRLFDQELDVRHSDVLSSSPTPLEPNNAYFGLMGFTAQTDKDFIQVGMDLIQTYENNLVNAGIDGISEEESSQIVGAPLTAAELNLIGVCRAYKEPDCAQKVLTELSQTFVQNEQPISSEMEQFISRYLKVVSLSDFAEPLNCTIATPIADYGTFLKASRFYLSYSLLQLSPEEFVSLIRADMLFWRKVLSQSETLIAKMVAVAALSFDIQLIEAANLKPEEKLSLGSAINPLTPEELDISEAFIAENKMMIREVLNYENYDDPIYQGDNWPALLSGNMLFQPNASANLSLEYFVEPLIYLSKLDGEAFKAEVDQFMKQQREKEAALTSGFFNMLYNPTGKLVISVGMMRGEDYISRVHQLNEQLKTMQ